VRPCPAPLLALLLLPAAAACDPPEFVNCLTLSPECARGEAELRVDVVNLAADTRRVVVTVDGTEHSTSTIRDGTVALYFFDLASGSATNVDVRVEAPVALRCSRTASTGKGTHVTVDARGPECSADTPDAGAADGGQGEDASVCLRDPDDGGTCDGGCCEDEDGGTQP
jgi:hypothetical protein